MTSEQYVESVKQMMNQQNIFFSIFLAIIAIVLAFVGVIQWRLSSKQVELIKQQTKEELEKEISQKLGVAEISEYPKKNEDLINSLLEKNQNNLNNLKKIVEEEKNKNMIIENFRFRIDLQNIFLLENLEIYKLDQIIDIYSTLLEEDIGNFNMYINYMSSWLSKLDSKGFTPKDNYLINKIIDKLKNIELKFVDKTNSELEILETKIKIMNQEK